MAKWLITATNSDGELKVALVNDRTDSALPYGDQTAITERLGGASIDAIIEMPDNDFRPLVIDPMIDGEPPMTFIDL